MTSAHSRADISPRPHVGEGEAAAVRCGGDGEEAGWREARLEEAARRAPRATAWRRHGRRRSAEEAGAGGDDDGRRRAREGAGGGGAGPTGAVQGSAEEASTEDGGAEDLGRHA